MIDLKDKKIEKLEWTVRQLRSEKRAFNQQNLYLLDQVDRLKALIHSQNEKIWARR